MFKNCLRLGKTQDLASSCGKISVFLGGYRQNSVFLTFLTSSHLLGCLGIKIRNCLFFQHYFEKIATVCYIQKQGEKKITSYIVLLSYQPTSTANSAIRAGLAVLVGFQLKRTIRRSIFSLAFAYKNRPRYIFLQRHIIMRHFKLLFHSLNYFLFLFS